MMKIWIFGFWRGFEKMGILFVVVKVRFVDHGLDFGD